jgi:hypothetical protein
MTLRERPISNVPRRTHGPSSVTLVHTANIPPISRRGNPRRTPSASNTPSTAHRLASPCPAKTPDAQDGLRKTKIQIPWRTSCHLVARLPRSCSTPPFTPGRGTPWRLGPVRLSRNDGFRRARKKAYVSQSHGSCRCVSAPTM